MSIFRKASELSSLPKSVEAAYFEDHTIEQSDEFNSLIKEASAHKDVYSSRVKAFAKNTPSPINPVVANQPQFYTGKDGVRRASYGDVFDDEVDDIRSIKNSDNDPYYVRAMNNGLSIWDAEFDEIQDAFMKSSRQDDEIFDRRTAMEKKIAEREARTAAELSKVRQAKVLPYRGLGVTRTGNEVSAANEKLNTVNDFVNYATDNIREMIREENRERKSKIASHSEGYTWTPGDNKESIRNRTLSAIEKDSYGFLASFADKINLDEI